MQGGLTFGLVGAIFLITLKGGMPDDEVRALTFISLVLSIVSLILVNRSFSTSLVAAFRRPNPALAWILLAVATTLGLSLFWPALLARVFPVRPRIRTILTLTVAAGIVVLIVPPAQACMANASRLVTDLMKPALDHKRTSTLSMTTSALHPEADMRRPRPRSKPCHNSSVTVIMTPCS